MSNLGIEESKLHLDLQPDAVQMAIIGTDSYDVSMWWYEAIRYIGSHMYPDLEDAFKEVAEYMANVAYNYHQK